MAATNVYVSAGVKREIEVLSDDELTTGTSGSATHFVELRIMTADASAVATGITIADVRKVLQAFERFLDNGGLLGTDANLPIL